MAAGGDTRIDTFGFQPGRLLSGKYEVVRCLGAGWEGEVYLVREQGTGIERTAKFFFPQRNPREITSRRYARRLHRLRHCPMVIQYHVHETVRFRGRPVTYLVSDYVPGTLLTELLRRQPGEHLEPHAAVHLLYALATGMECIHGAGEYHGDLHSDNVIVQRFGLGFEVKLVDMFHWEDSKRECMRADIVDMVRIFYDALGGRARYGSQPKVVKDICRGLKQSLILRRFRTAGALRVHLEQMDWR